MKGLILKDFYMIWKSCKTLFLISVIFIATSFIGEDNMIFAVFPIMFMGMIPVTLLAYDERSRWTEYCGALPYSNAQIVSGKFIVGLITQAATSLVVFIVLCIKETALQLWHIDISELLTYIAAMFIISLLFTTICMPFSLKYGTEKGRMVYYMVFAAVGGIVVLIMKITDSFLVHNPNLIYIYAVAFPVLYLLSWVESIIIYNKKELGK